MDAETHWVPAGTSRIGTGDLVQRSIWWSDSGGEPLGDGVGTSRQTEESLPADMRLATMQAA
jgi:hypothetical protein